MRPLTGGKKKPRKLIVPQWKGNTGRPLNRVKNLQRQINSEARMARVEAATRVAQALAQGMRGLINKDPSRDKVPGLPGGPSAT